MTVSVERDFAHRDDQGRWWMRSRAWAAPRDGAGPRRPFLGTVRGSVEFQGETYVQGDVILGSPRSAEANGDPTARLVHRADFEAGWIEADEPGE